MTRPPIYSDVQPCRLKSFLISKPRGMKRESTLTVQSEEPPKLYRQAALMDKNRTGPGENFVQKDDFEVQQEALWRWAADHVTPWGKVQKDDYDFRWTNGAAKELLEAGCIYEYARESRKLRCLLVLMDPGRKREPFEIMALSRTGRLLTCLVRLKVWEKKMRAARWVVRFVGCEATPESWWRIRASRTCFARDKKN